MTDVLDTDAPREFLQVTQHVSTCASRRRYAILSEAHVSAMPPLFFAEIWQKVFYIDAPIRVAIRRRCHACRRTNVVRRFPRMTTRNVNKTSARNLATLTGMPYQKCLTAVEVLRQVPQGLTLGDLGEVMAGNGSRHSVLHLPDDEDLSYRLLFTAPYGPLYDEAEIVVIAGKSPAMLARIDGELWGALPSGARLWLELYLSEESLRPFGTWKFSAGALRFALESSSMTVLAEQVQDVNSFPDSLTTGRRTRAAYIGHRLATVQPSYVTAGPGFNWAHISFSDLDMVYEPNEVDHRLIECDESNCQWLHGWPTANPTHTRITLPAPLLVAYQKIWTDHAYSEEDFNNESYISHEIADNGSNWYGLDVPGYFTIWMNVDDHGAYPTGPPSEHPVKLS